MWLLIAAGLVAGGLLAWSVKTRWPDGVGPYDVMPAAWQGTPPATSQSAVSSSGNVYRVESWPVKDGQTFHVARLAPGLRSYVAYSQVQSTGQRLPWRAWAADEDEVEAAATLASMRRDFGA